MQVDKITLQDIGLFDKEDQIGLASHLNFCKSNGGKAKLETYLHQPLSSLPLIEARQKALTYIIFNLDTVDALKISNGTSLVIEKFFETGFKTIPAQVTPIGALWYQLWNNADYALIKYSVSHLVQFFQNMMHWASIFEEVKDNSVIEKLVQNIKRITDHPSLLSIKEQRSISNPQQILSLGYFFMYLYKNNTRDLLECFYDADALFSMAKAKTTYQFEFPNWREAEQPLLEVIAAAHPMVNDAVPNNLSLRPTQNFLFLTGANMAGKSTFIKTIGIVVYLSHIGMGAPAKKVNLTVMDGLITNLNIADNLIKGESYFYNEVQRIKNTVVKISDGKKYIVLIDELFKGTNILDAMKCSTKVIEGLQKLKSSLFVLSTHLYEISEQIKSHQNIQFSYFETQIKDQELHFQYQLKPGVSQDRIGYLILEKEGVVKLLDQL